MTFGEETYDLRGLRLTVKSAAILPLAVEFAIHPTERVVFVRTFRYVRRGYTPPTNGNHDGPA